MTAETQGRWTAPPTGADLDAFLSDVRTNVFDRTEVRPRKRRFRWAAGVSSVVMLLGLGTAGGALASGWLGMPVYETATFSVPTPDFIPSDLIVTLTCLKAGTYTIDVSDVSDGEMTMTCDETGTNSTGTDQIAVDGTPRARTVTVTASVGGGYSVDSSYVARMSANYPKNEAGQTFGMPEAGTNNLPDLHFVVGSDASGKTVQGYILYRDTEMPPIPDDLALAWLRDFRVKYPEGQPLPMFASDGTTVVGIFRLFR